MSSLKAELIKWHEAVLAYGKNDVVRALELFEGLSGSAKVEFNIGVILAGRGDHEGAINAYVDALKLDQYFAVAYFQKGVSNFLMQRFEDAIDDFNDAFLYLRGNVLIDYEQLGLEYKLYSCEVLSNRALCYLYLNKEEEAVADLVAASKEKQTPDHEIISRALEEGIDLLDLFSMPQGLLYRPPESKMKNLHKVDYLGSSKLIAAVERNDMFTGFKGAHLRKVAQSGDGDSAVSGPPSLQRAVTIAGTSDNSLPSLKLYKNNQFTRRAQRSKLAEGQQTSPENSERGAGGLVGSPSTRVVGLQRRATEQGDIRENSQFARRAQQKRLAEAQQISPGDPERGAGGLVSSASARVVSLQRRATERGVTHEFA